MKVYVTNCTEGWLVIDAFDPDTKTRSRESYSATFLQHVVPGRITHINDLNVEIDVPAIDCFKIYWNAAKSMYVFAEAKEWFCESCFKTTGTESLLIFGVCSLCGEAITGHDLKGSIGRSLLDILGLDFLRK